jgi:hypothetical protein
VSVSASHTQAPFFSSLNVTLRGALHTVGVGLQAKELGKGNEKINLYSRGQVAAAYKKEKELNKMEEEKNMKIYRFCTKVKISLFLFLYFYNVSIFFFFFVCNFISRIIKPNEKNKEHQKFSRWKAVEIEQKIKKKEKQMNMVSTQAWNDDDDDDSFSNHEIEDREEMLDINNIDNRKYVIYFSFFFFFLFKS